MNEWVTHVLDDYILMGEEGEDDEMGNYSSHPAPPLVPLDVSWGTGGRCTRPIVLLRLENIKGDPKKCIEPQRKTKTVCSNNKMDCA